MMTGLVRVALATSVLSFAFGCGSDEKLDRVATRLDALEKKVDALSGRVAGGGGQKPPARPTLDPNTVYAVPVNERDPWVGAKHAKVTIVEAYEYACPYCKTANEVLDGVVERRAADVKLVGKQLVVHPQVATNASLAACAAAQQGKYGAFSKALWRSAWGNGPLDATKLAPEALAETAKSVGLDPARLAEDMKSCAPDLERTQRELAGLGVNGTPAFFINGRPYVGPRTAEAFSAAIDEAVKKADEAIASGVKLEDYYASLVKTGKRAL